MSLSPLRSPLPFLRTVRRLQPAPSLDARIECAPTSVREPDDQGAGGAAPELSWRASSHDLKHGLDVVELPTSLPVDVLDRLFRAPGT